MFSTDIKFRQENFQLDVKLHLPAGKITTLLGPSGSGKTTLLRLMAGLQKPQSGNIRSGDHLLYDSQTELFVAPQKRKVGLMFQDYALFEHMTLAENIAYGVEKSKRNNVVEHWLQQINLSHRCNDYPPMLSGGEKQRVALARALACEPEVLLLDEPFSALDMILRHELRREIQMLIQNSAIPVLLATHDLEEARLISDHVIVMVNGAIVRSGEVGEVFRDPGNVSAARALGWHNILPVDQTSENQVSGAWGQLSIPLKQTDGAVKAIGVSGNNIEIHSTGPGLEAEIVHVVELDFCQILEVRFADNTRFIVEHNSSAGRLQLRQKVKLLVNCSSVRVFYE